MDLGGFQDPCVPQMLNKGTKIDFCVIKWIFLREHVHLKRIETTRFFGKCLSLVSGEDFIDYLKVENDIV